VLLALVLLAVVFFLIAQIVGEQTAPTEIGGRAGEAVVAERIKPVGQINISGQAPVGGEAAPAATVAAASAAGSRSGQAVVDAYCGVCHATGAAGAPKIGDAAVWQPRIAQGADVLLQNATHGIRAMPPKGTCMDCSDDELKAAIAVLTGSAPAAEAPAAEAAAVPAATTADAGVDGKKVYDSSCMACHATGAAGAPKVGDKAAWAPRIAQGLETLVKNAISGIRAMPPKGTCMSCSDADLKAAIEYMVGQSQ
jgi:cytochrome c5